MLVKLGEKWVNPQKVMYLSETQFGGNTVLILDGKVEIVIFMPIDEVAAQLNIAST